MKLCPFFGVVLFAMVMYPVASLGEATFHNENDDFELDPDEEYGIGLRANDRPKKLFFSDLPRSAVMSFDDQQMLSTTSECVTPLPDDEPTPPVEEISLATSEPEQDATQPPQPTPSPPETQQTTMSSTVQENKTKELRNLVQHLYIAQARVQLEASEIKKAQSVANTAQQALEEAANHVRAITASLQSSQQEVASAAIRAQTAQLQLAAHDQLLFAARQDVDALSSQMVGLQAEEGISQPQITVDLSRLLEKLKEPLAESEKPTPVPPLVQIPTVAKSKRIFQVRRNHQQHVEPGFRELYLT